ncbi:tRNA dimethylallyltransferase isoform X2 [Sitophilus oryzae]|nr:tRNA dimethylallyltransferase isoform X2 [Sitophilus oryzae]XP_030753780.1 tRNA dimethylallyltransferase isoform X2 [Sitophilus oryzae]XP_030753781.1 tRNA dimethylallyltransferase isoform X2 [Sitophilus oryzae]
MGSKMSIELPVVIVLGSTGTGKTKLSLELAKKFSGEIIGADSMQIYRNLDIASAKATKDEQSIAPHHMIDILEPSENFTVLEYRNKVLPIIDNLLKYRKLPIIVGGTNYYIESILYKTLVQEIDEVVCEKAKMLAGEDYELPSEQLHKKLMELDPAMAKRLHPNNKRKIMRSLEVLYTKGRKHSEILEHQHTQSLSKSDGGLRYSNAVILWLQCNQNILNKRLDDRVDNMIQEGLLDELLAFHKSYNEQRIKNNEELDYTKGVFQSIGFKEFHDYLLLNDEEKASKDGQKILHEAIERLKLVTRRYARKQIKWVVNRFLGRKNREVPPIYALDTSDVSKWEVQVKQPAFQIVQQFISGTPCGIQPVPLEEKDSVPSSMMECFTCDICNKTLVGQIQRKDHFNSSRHRKMVAKAKKEQQSVSEVKINSTC